MKVYAVTKTTWNDYSLIVSNKAFINRDEAWDAMAKSYWEELKETKIDGVLDEDSTWIDDNSAEVSSNAYGSTAWAIHELEV